MKELLYVNIYAKMSSFASFFQPFLFEELPAIDLTAQESYLNEAAHSEIYLGIFGKDYGD